MRGRSLRLSHKARASGRCDAQHGEVREVVVGVGAVEREDEIDEQLARRGIEQVAQRRRRAP